MAGITGCENGEVVKKIALYSYEASTGTVGSGPVFQFDARVVQPATLV